MIYGIRWKFLRKVSYTIKREINAGSEMMEIRKKIYVSIPFSMLIETYLDAFIEHRINPEISFGADCLDKYSTKEYEYVAGRLHSQGLSINIHAPYTDLCPGSPDPMVREVASFRLNQILSIVPIFNAKSVVCHTGFDEKKYYEIRDVWRDNSLEIWRRVAEGLKEDGATLMLENVFEKRPEDMIFLINGLSSYDNVRLCFDAGHAHIFSIIPLDRWTLALAPFIGELHLHNNSGNWDEHRGLDKGLIDFKALLGLISQHTNYLPIITFEVHNDEEFWSSLEYLEKIWPWKEE